MHTPKPLRASTAKTRLAPTSRRRFLSRAPLAFLGSGCLLSASRTTAQPASPTRFGGFRVGIQSNSLARLQLDTGTLLQTVADLGVSRIEFIGGLHYPVTDDPAAIERMQSLLTRAGLTMDSYFHGEMPADEERLRALFAFSQRNGIRTLVGMPTPEAFPLLDALVKTYDIRVALHNYGPGARYERVEHLLAAVAPWDWRIGYCLDTGHTMRVGEDPVAAVRRLAGRLYALHLREHAAIQRDPQPPETRVGEGALDLAAFCQALRQTHFSGPLIFEIYHNPADPLDAIRRSLDAFAAAARHA